MVNGTMWMTSSTLVEQGYVSEYDMTEETDDEAFLFMNFALLSESGFDMNNEEACALAAESLQLENEAYMLRTQGKGKGHGGFQQQRQFDISGQVSFQERKARLAQLKAKTECRRCGMKGHWSGDAACPKGPRKGSNSAEEGIFTLLYKQQEWIQGQVHPTTSRVLCTSQ